MEQLIRHRRIERTDNFENINCKNCSKNIVCTLYRGIQTLINNNWSGNAKPFEPEIVGMICKHFTATIIDTT